MVVVVPGEGIYRYKVHGVRACVCMCVLSRAEKEKNIVGNAILRPITPSRKCFGLSLNLNIVKSNQTLHLIWIPYGTGQGHFFREGEIMREQTPSNTQKPPK